MDRSGPPPSHEAEPLTNLNFQPRVSAEDSELRNHSYCYASRPPSPSLSSATDYSAESEGVPPTNTPADNQEQQHVETHHEKDQDPSHQEKTYKSDKNLLRPWLWELLSIAAAALALVAIVIILALHGKRPLPKWPLSITINASIAVFTAIFKACLIMPIAECIGQLKWLWYEKSRPLKSMEQWDLASRGPWGSLLLIFTLKSRGVVVIGAVLTIAAMAVDPVTQQIVQSYSCSKVVEGESGTINFSNNYTTGPWQSEIVTSSSWDPQMQSAIYMGLLAPLETTSGDVQFQCRTGNCTFPSTEDGATFRSLALESQCTDIGSEIVFSTGFGDWSWGVYHTDDMIASASIPRYNLTLSRQVEGGIDEPLVLHPGEQFIHASEGEWPPPGDWPSSMLHKVSYLMYKSRQLPEPQYTCAFECEFYPAVQTYSANIRNGILVEQVLDTQRMDVWPIVDVRFSRSGYALLIVEKAIREGKWHECTGSPTPSPEHNLPVKVSMDESLSAGHYGPIIATGFDSSQMPSPLSNVTWWPQDCVYSMPPQVMLSLAEAISRFLGNETVIFDHVENTKIGTPWGLRIWNDGAPTLEAIQDIMDGMTRSITARLREGDGFSISSGPAYGQVWETQTCVYVNWSWLGLPAGLLLLTIVFLCLTMLKTRSRQARVWKSSVFAVLFSGLDQETQKAAGPVMGLEEMKAFAGKATVRLEDTKEGFRLVSQA